MAGLVGPIFFDLDKLSFDGDRAVIATAFYSRSALFQLKIASERLDLMMRLDLASCEEWKRGMIDPAALAAFVIHQQSAGVKVNLFVHPIAHAKVYVGEAGYFVGSANLTLKGFSGVGHELLWFEENAANRLEMLQSLDTYTKNFRTIKMAALEKYIEQRQEEVATWRKANPSKFRKRDQDRVESDSTKAARYGDYEAFKSWLAKRPEAGAATILRRANGESGLSGHIKANFFGLRQWFLFDSKMLALARTKTIDTYKLQNTPEEAHLKVFVDNHAADEPDFSLGTWRGYLPKECGGNVGKHGGTIGNLNRMIPLFGKYLP